MPTVEVEGTGDWIEIPEGMGHIVALNCMVEVNGDEYRQMTTIRFDEPVRRIRFLTKEQADKNPGPLS